MQQFISELATLIVTLSVLIMATILMLLGHAILSDITPIVSPVIIFWFYKGAFTWQPTQQVTTAPLQGVSPQEKVS